ncbi:MAG: rhodanese-like domain-containing protein [Halodesulfurarchaeum sp.]
MPGEIDPEELLTLLDSEDPVRVVDIRSPHAYETGHVPESENVPFEDLVESMEDLDGASHVVTICPHGEASMQAARLIESYEGVPDDARIESLAGGLEAWDGPLVRE